MSDPIGAAIGIGSSLLGGGSKGGSEATQKLPQWQEDAWKANIEAQKQLNSIGYMPNYAPTRAKFNPLLKQAVNNTQKASQAFGMSSPTNVLDNMTNTTFADRMIKDLGMGELVNINGIEGYAAGNLLDASKQLLGEKAPGQLSAYESLFVDPVEGLVAETDSETSQDYEAFMRAYMAAMTATSEGQPSANDAMTAWNVYQQTGYAPPEVKRFMDNGMGSNFRLENLGIG